MKATGRSAENDCGGGRRRNAPRQREPQLGQLCCSLPSYGTGHGGMTFASTWRFIFFVRRAEHGPSELIAFARSNQTQSLIRNQNKQAWLFADPVSCQISSSFLCLLAPSYT